MNLKSFHFVFIVASALVAFLFAGWELANYRAFPEVASLAGVIIATVTGVALLIYGIIFKRKARKLIL